MTPVIYVLLGLFAGVVLIGIVVAVMVLFRYMKELKNSLDELQKVLKVISKDNTLVESLSSFKNLVNVGNVMIQKISTLTTTVDLFYKVAVRADQLMQTGASPATPGDSEIYFSDEEQAAQRETQRKLRQSGVQMPPDKEIPSDKAVGAQV